MIFHKETKHKWKHEVVNIVALFNYAEEKVLFVM